MYKKVVLGTDQGQQRKEKLGDRKVTCCRDQKEDCESRAANKYGHCTGGINLKTKNKNEKHEP